MYFNSTLSTDIPPIFYRIFTHDEYIFEAMHDLDVPWDHINHRSYFIPKDILLPEIYVVEFKDFIPFRNWN